MCHGIPVEETAFLFFLFMSYRQDVPRFFKNSDYSTYNCTLLDFVVDAPSGNQAAKEKRGALQYACALHALRRIDRPLSAEDRTKIRKLSVSRPHFSPPFVYPFLPRFNGVMNLNFPQPDVEKHTDKTNTHCRPLDVRSIDRSRSMQCVFHVL